MGSLVNQYKKRVRDGEAHALFSDRASEELGDILWYVANLATKLDLTLNDIAVLNLRRIHERWPRADEAVPARLLDDDFPPGERLPRRGTLRFLETLEKGRARVRIELDGAVVGDALSDMAWEDDDYRYHDAFHIAYAVLLGWSPVFRSMLNRQRASDPRYREVEDSGRAKVIDEAVAAVIFEYAREQRFLEGVDHIDSALLQTVRAMTSRLEVRIRTLHEWQRAIVESFVIWRQLRTHHGGTITFDLTQRQLVFSPPK